MDFGPQHICSLDSIPLRLRLPLPLPFFLKYSIKNICSLKTSHGVQTRVEASMWRLGLSGGGAGGGGGGGEAYPERSNEPDRGAAFAGTVQDVGLITREIVERCWRCERRSWRRWSFTGENGTTGLSAFYANGNVGVQGVWFLIEPRVVVYLSLWDDVASMFKGLINSGNLYLNSTPATKFYFNPTLQAISEFTASLEGTVG
ncbi:Uncharacterized protein Rs2_28978 [Raphanus sativus]|nr:Uncharacterized protein Rs2_28978 [Raphanus sativus]